MEMKTAGRDDLILLHFTAALEDGTIVESSRDREPDEVRIGTTKVNPLIEKAITGMKAGEKKTVIIPAAKAYGKYNKKLIIRIRKDRLNIVGDPEEGDYIRIRTDEGKELYLPVKAVSEKTITVDSNHPLAGKDLVYEIELVAFVEKH